MYNLTTTTTKNKNKKLFKNVYLGLGTRPTKATSSGVHKLRHAKRGGGGGGGV